MDRLEGHIHILLEGLHLTYFKYTYCMDKIYGPIIGGSACSDDLCEVNR